MTNLQHFLIAYKHIKVLSLPSKDSSLFGHVLTLKASADVIFEKCLSDILDTALSAEQPSPSVSLGAKREGRRK